jgi:membrane associated rhomboid family serine protease
MFPLRDDNPTGRTAYLTIALILANVLVYLYEFIQPDQGQRVMMQFGFIPVERPGVN